MCQRRVTMWQPLPPPLFTLHYIQYNTFMKNMCSVQGQSTVNITIGNQQEEFGRVQLTIHWDENSQDLLHNLQLPLNGSSFNAVIHRGE